MKEQLKALTDLITSPNSSLEGFEAAVAQAKGVDLNHIEVGSGTYNSLLKACLLNPTDQNFEIFKYLIEKEGVRIEDTLSARDNAFDCQNMPADAQAAHKFLDYIDKHVSDRQKNQCQLFNLAIFFNHQVLFNGLLANPNIGIASEGARNSTPLVDVFGNAGRAEIMNGFIASERFRKGEAGEMRPELLVQIMAVVSADSFDKVLANFRNYPGFESAVQGSVANMTAAFDKPGMITALYNKGDIDYKKILSSDVIFNFDNLDSTKPHVQEYIRLLFLSNPMAIDLVLAATGNSAAQGSMEKLAYILECVRDSKGLDFKHIAKPEHETLLSKLNTMNTKELRRLMLSLNITDTEAFYNNLRILGGKGAAVGINKLEAAAKMSTLAYYFTMLFSDPMELFSGPRTSDPIKALSPLSYFPDAIATAAVKGKAEEMVQAEVVSAKAKLLAGLDTVNKSEFKSQFAEIVKGIQKDIAKDAVNIFESFIKTKPEMATAMLDALSGIIAKKDLAEFYKKAFDAASAGISDVATLNAFNKSLEGNWMTNWQQLFNANKLSGTVITLDAFKDLYNDYKSHGMNPNYAELKTPSYDTSLIIELLARPNENTLEIIKYLVEEEKLDLANLLSSRNLAFNPQTKLPDAQTLKYAQDILDYIDSTLPSAEAKNKTELLQLAIYFNHADLFTKLLSDPKINIGQNAAGLRGDPPAVLLSHHTDRAALLDAFVLSDRFNAESFTTLGDPDRILVSLCQYGSDIAWNTALEKLKSHPEFDKLMSDALLQMHTKEIDSSTKEADKEWLGRMPARISQVFAVSNVNSLTPLENVVSTVSLFMNSYSDTPTNRLKLDLLMINDPRVVSIFNKAFFGLDELNEYGNSASEKFSSGIMAMRLTYLRAVERQDGVDYKAIAGDEQLKFLEFLKDPKNFEITRLVENLDVRNVDEFCDKLSDLTGNKPEYQAGIKNIKDLYKEKATVKIYDPILSSDPMDMAMFLGSGQKGRNDNTMYLAMKVNEIAREMASKELSQPQVKAPEAEKEEATKKAPNKTLTKTSRSGHAKVAMHKETGSFAERVTPQHEEQKKKREVKSPESRKSHVEKVKGKGEESGRAF